MRISVYRQRLCSFEGALLVTEMKDDYLGNVCSGVAGIFRRIIYFDCKIRVVRCIIEIIHLHINQTTPYHTWVQREVYMN